MFSRRHFISTLAAGTVATSFMNSSSRISAAGSKSYNVIDYGAVADGITPSGDGFQKALDKAEANGGGIVFIPAGKYLLEKTPLVGTNVHLMGVGRGSVLIGERPDNHYGAALISNKGQQASGFEGARDWSISHIAIDSPKTNGIVVTHAKNVYLSHIYGVDAYHHFIDTVGKNIICENLFLTGHSGTSTFQIDSLAGAQTIWDGNRAVSPNIDGTETKDLILRNSIITATAGTQGERPLHDTSIHFHGGVSDGFLFSDLILGGADNGIYMDEGCSYSNIQMTNITSYNPGRAIWFEPSEIKQYNVSIRGFIHQPKKLSEKLEGYSGISIHGTEKLTLSDIFLNIPIGEPCLDALELSACKKVEISTLNADAENGTAIKISDSRDSSGTVSGFINISNCMLEGFQTGLEYIDNNSGGSIYQWGNHFIDIPNPIKGEKIISS